MQEQGIWVIAVALLRSGDVGVEHESQDDVDRHYDEDGDVLHSWLHVAHDVAGHVVDHRQRREVDLERVHGFSYFDGGIDRSPYETADGYLQVTRGRSHNRCLFCTYFKDVKFSKSPLDEIEADIREIPRNFGTPSRIFLQGADGFAADYDTPMRVAELLRDHAPTVQTIGGYARIDDFYDKTEEQLRNMAQAGFADPYIGMESGDDAVLKRIGKGYSAA